MHNSNEFNLHHESENTDADNNTISAMLIPPSGCDVTPPHLQPPAALQWRKTCEIIIWTLQWKTRNKYVEIYDNRNGSAYVPTMLSPHLWIANHNTMFVEHGNRERYFNWQLNPIRKLTAKNCETLHNNQFSVCWLLCVAHWVHPLNSQKPNAHILHILCVLCVCSSALFHGYISFSPYSLTCFMAFWQIRLILWCDAPETFGNRTYRQMLL